MQTDSIVIYHNPRCGTSRNTLAMIRNSGVEPQVIEYLQAPPDYATLHSLLMRAGLTARDLVRTKESLYAELGLDDPSMTEDALIAAMLKHPILMNRPLVVTPLGVKLCRPSEKVLSILANPQQQAFTKEDGEKVVDEHGKLLIKID